MSRSNKRDSSWPDLFGLRSSKHDTTIFFLTFSRLDVGHTPLTEAADDCLEPTTIAALPLPLQPPRAHHHSCSVPYPTTTPTPPPSLHYPFPCDFPVQCPAPYSLQPTLAYHHPSSSNTETSRPPSSLSVNKTIGPTILVLHHAAYRQIHSFPVTTN